MKKDAPFEYTRSHLLKLDFNMNFNILQFNVNSLKAHKHQLEKDNLIPSFHAVMLCETWLIKTDSIPEYDSHTPIRNDYVAENRSQGLLMYVHKDFHIVKECRPVAGVSFQHQMIIIEPRLNVNLRICLVNLYIHPKCTSNQVIDDLERLFQNLPQGMPVFIGGDFNIDTLVQSSVSRKFKALLRYYGLRAVNHRPTHFKGGSIDHIITNMNTSSMTVDMFSTYYSDHLPVGLSIPMASLTFETDMHRAFAWISDVTGIPRSKTTALF